MLIENEEEMSCTGVRGVVRGVNVDTAATNLTFGWKKPTCDAKRGDIIGYEYSVEILR